MTYLLTPWSGVLLLKPNGSLLVKKFPAFYGDRRFITAYTSADHLPLSWDSPIQSMPHPTSWRCILILSSNLGLGLKSGSFSQLFHQNPYAPLLYPIRAIFTAYLILLDLISRIIFGEDYRSLSSSLCSFLHSHVTSFLLGSNIPLSTLFSNTLSLRSSLNVSEHVSHPYRKKQAKL